jgi:hypothetical protein
MTAAEATRLAQSDPVPNLTRQYAECTQAAKKHLEYLVTELRAIDNLADTLTEHGLTVSVDLGPIGNAAAAARRDLEKRKDAPAFKLPRPA